MNTNSAQSAHDAGVCEFCGKQLEEGSHPVLAGFDSNGKAIKKYRTYFKSCNCEGALAAKRKRYELDHADQERRLKEAYDRAGIPKRFWDADDKDDTRLISKLKGGQGLFFTGLPGRGKTYMACSIARKFIAEGYTVRFCDIESLEREVKSAWSSRTMSERDVIDKYVKASLTIIDDLGAEELTPMTMKVLRAVISGREAYAGVTIITSNYDRKEFAQHLAAETDDIKAQRIASRVSGMTEVIRFNGPDRRLSR